MIRGEDQAPAVFRVVSASAAPPAIGDAELASRLGPVSVLSPFCPHDGIARYSEQLAAAVKAFGVPVTRLGLAHCGTGGDLSVDLTRGMRFLRVIRLVPDTHTLLVMWHPAYLTGGRQLTRILALASTAVGFGLRRTIVLQHEPDDDLLSDVEGPRRLTRLLEERLRALMWHRAAEIWFHSFYERDAFRVRYPAAAAGVVLRIVEHQARDSAVDMSKAEARRHLGAPLDEPMFLCLGFLSVRKGVDHVLRAFASAAPTHGRLWVVGDAVNHSEETRRHVADLQRLASSTKNVEWRERYVDDVEFDMWLRAADFVVAAYRTAASSGVIARAQLLGARVIGSGAGGTAEQLRPEVDLVAADDGALVEIFKGETST